MIFFCSLLASVISDKKSFTNCIFIPLNCNFFLLSSLLFILVFNSCTIVVLGMTFFICIQLGRFFFFFFFFFFFCFSLQLLVYTYTTATAIPVPSCICDLHHSLQQHWILNPLSESRDQTSILRDTILGS